MPSNDVESTEWVVISYPSGTTKHLPKPSKSVELDDVTIYRALSARVASLMAENAVLKAEIHTLRTLVMGLTAVGKPKPVTDWTAFSHDPSAPLIEK